MKPYAIQKAVDFLAGALAAQRWRDGDRLPPLRQLADLAEVSGKSMWTAIGLLKKQGVVSARRGSRIYAGQKPVTTIDRQSEKAGSSRALRTRIENDIFKGQFQPGKLLPSYSELQARYGICHQTLRKVLGAMSVDQVIIPHKKKFLVPRIETKQYQSSVYLIWEVGSLEELKRKSDREVQFIESLERECSQAGVALHFIDFNIEEVSPIDSIMARFRDQSIALGYIIHPISFQDKPALIDVFGALLVRLARFKKPIAVFDELGFFPLPQSLASHPQVKVFRVADASAGRSVGRLLLTLGHLRVAYISQFQNELWSISRLKGMRAEFEHAGFPDSISLFSMTFHESIIDSILKPAGLTEKLLLETIPHRLDIPEDRQPAPQQALHLSGYLKSKEEMIKELRFTARSLAHIPEKQMNAKALRYARNNGISWVRRDLVRILLEFLFEKAIADKSITAWVIANDDAAVIAREFLRARKIRVPEALSLVSFDNQPNVFEAGVSSFDFDIQNSVRQILSYIIHPTRTGIFTKKNYIELPGFIVQRGSTGKAKI